MNTQQNEFCEKIYNLLKKYAPDYNIKAYPAIIAQAIIESGWGNSELSVMYNNYFGLKCGAYWKGKSVNMETHEEYDGKDTVIYDNFRVFDSIEDGVKGYFDFINTSRYRNLKGVLDSKTYVTLIKADGYSNSSTYVGTIMNVINCYDLEQYAFYGDVDNVPISDIEHTDAEYIKLAEECLAGKHGNGDERRTNVTKLGFDYDKVQNIVNFFISNTKKKTNETIANEVIKGNWGNGKERKDKLIANGYDYDAIQKIVNEKLR